MSFFKKYPTKHQRTKRAADFWLWAVYNSAVNKIFNVPTHQLHLGANRSRFRIRALTVSPRQVEQKQRVTQAVRSTKDAFKDSIECRPPTFCSTHDLPLNHRSCVHKTENFRRKHSGWSDEGEVQCECKHIRHDGGGVKWTCFCQSRSAWCRDVHAGNTRLLVILIAPDGGQSWSIRSTYPKVKTTAGSWLDWSCAHTEREQQTSPAASVEGSVTRLAVFHLSLSCESPIELRTKRLRTL